MKLLRAVCLVILAYMVLASRTPVLGQRLPEGDDHNNRERSIDILHYRANLRFNFEEQSIAGQAIVRFRPLAPTNVLSLDAIRLSIDTVQLLGSESRLAFQIRENYLDVTLDRQYCE